MEKDESNKEGNIMKCVTCHSDVSGQCCPDCVSTIWIQTERSRIMPALPIKKEITLPDNWVQLQKTIIPDDKTDSYWSVWYDNNSWTPSGRKKGTAWLMCCPFGDDPSVNDSWGHAEEIDDRCRNVLTSIESIYGVSFHDSIWVEMGATEVFPART